MQRRPSIVTACLLIVLALSSMDAQSPATSRVGSDSLHRLIAGFLAEPFKNGVRFRDILDSAKSSPHVSIKISYGVAPWMCELSMADTSMIQAIKGLLLGAFVAGDMRSQLETGMKGDQPLLGVDAALTVYTKTKARVPDLSVPTLDRWLDLPSPAARDSAVTEAAAHPPMSCSKLQLISPAG